MNQRSDIEDLLKTSKSYEKTDKDRVVLFEGLVKNTAFQAYLDLLEELIQVKGSEILSPAGNMDGLVALEFVKGALNGLILARDLVPLTIAHMTQFKQPIEEEEDDTDVSE